MSVNKPVELDGICRFCGLQKNYGKYLFSNESITSGLITKIEQQFPPEIVFIEENDNLTKFICFQCELTINYLSEFCTMVKDVQHNLKEKQSSILLENQQLCHTVEVLKNAGTITLCIGSDGSATCQYCQIQLDSTHLSSLNLIAQTQGRVYCCCIVCGYKDEGKVFLNIKEHSIQCPQCVYIYNEKQQGNKEILQNEKKQHLCDICNKYFRSKGHLNRHKLTHFSVKQFSCEVCNMKFSQKSVLKTHTLIHKQENPFSCKWCCQSFRYKTSLQGHMINYHGSFLENKNAYECDRCKKCFISKVKLKVHYRSHSGEQPYKCNICNKRFSQNINLRTHSKRHEQDDNQFSTNNTTTTTIYDTEPLLQNDQNEKYLGEIFTNCEPLTLDSIQIVDDNFNPKVSNDYDDSLIVNEELNSKPSSPCNIFYNVSSPSYTMYSPSDTDLFGTNESVSKSSLLPTFCSLNADSDNSICI